MFVEKGFRVLILVAKGLHLAGFKETLYNVTPKTKRV
jgi:hypothetical protein